MRIALPLLALLVLAMTTAPAPAQPGAGLDGTWLAVSAERNGAPAPDVVGHRLTAGNGRFRIAHDGKTVYGGTYVTDASKTPAQMDFHNTEGGLRGTWKGIYAVDGDTLKTCDNAPDMTKPRPETFAAGPGSGYVSIVFRREKK